MSNALIIASARIGQWQDNTHAGFAAGLAQRRRCGAWRKVRPRLYRSAAFNEAGLWPPPARTSTHWAMSRDRLVSLAAGDELLLIEGAMGLFDGAPPDGKGATANLARELGIPVILVVDCSHMAQSVAALVEGFLNHDPRVQVAGLILNKLGSPPPPKT